jgi:hypothetical protein
VRHNAALPDSLKDAPESLIEAWQVYQSAMAPVRAALKAEASPQSPPGGDHVLLGRTLRAWVAKRQPDAWRDLAKCEWRGFCGTGSDMLYHPRSRGILVSLLTDGRLAEAAGASLMLTSNSMGIGDNTGSMNLEIPRFLTALGLDWELLYAGSLLPGSGGDFARMSETGRAAISDYRNEHHPWSVLAASGSARGVQLGLDLIRFANIEARDAMDFLTRALGPEPSRPGVTVFRSGDDRPERTQPVSAASRREVLAVMAGYLAPTRESEELAVVLDELPFHTVAELRPQLITLAAHRSPKVSAKARALLGSAGLATKLPPPATDFAPLRLRLLFHGQPLAGAKLRIDFVPRQGLDSDATTDSDGKLNIPLIEALDPALIRSMKIQSSPTARISLGIPGFDGADETSAPAMEAEEATPWFSTEFPVTAQQTEVRDVSIPLAPLEIRLSAANEVRTPSVEITLQRFESPDGESLSYASAALSVRPGGVARFTRLQPGKYLLTIRGAGVASREFRDLRVPQGGLVLPVTLEAGYAVSGTAHFPSGTDLPLIYAAELFRGDEPWPRYLTVDSAAESWTGLPVGKYRAVIAADTDGVPENRHGRVEMEFELKADSPAKLDLGEIKVPPAP